MYVFESKVKRRSTRDRWSTTRSPRSTSDHALPVSYELSAQGYDPAGGPGISFHQPVPNQMYSQEFKQWRNLGGVTHQGVPVPTGATP